MSVHKVTVTKMPNTDQDLPDDEYVDEIEFTSECPGGSCSLWYECLKCEAYKPTEDEEEDGKYERHGKLHQLIDGDWMTDSGHCAINSDSGSDAMSEAAEKAGLGTHEIELWYWGDGVWDADLIKPTEANE